MSENLLIHIEQRSITDIIDDYAREDRRIVNDEIYAEYVESIIADQSSSEWVDVVGGNVYKFDVIGTDENSYAVGEWLSDEPVKEICADTLPRIVAMVGERYEILTVWQSRFDVHEDYFGDNEAYLELELIGELDMVNSHKAVMA